MKRTYGTLLTRLLSGGAKLTEVEFQLLEGLVHSLPEPLRSTVETQFGAYNLVQREVDGRALNFYRKTKGRADNTDGFPLLEMATEEAPLVRLTANLDGESDPVHATLTVVKGRVFCMALNRALRGRGRVPVLEVKQAWRANFHYDKS